MGGIGIDSDNFFDGFRSVHHAHPDWVVFYFGADRLIVWSFTSCLVLVFVMMVVLWFTLSALDFILLLFSARKALCCIDNIYFVFVRWVLAAAFLPDMVHTIDGLRGGRKTLGWGI